MSTRLVVLDRDGVINHDSDAHIRSAGQWRAIAGSLHAMPLAVGMYLPWTVTFPILFGGVIYKLVVNRSRSRGDSEEVRQAVIHRGLLFGSGLVAGEAIMAIGIAVMMVAEVPMPLMGSWAAGGTMVDIVSMLGFLGIMALLVKKALARREA